MNRLPRVLIITSEPFGGNTSSAFTLATLFKPWPKECLAQIYTKALVPDFEVCSRYWQLQTLKWRGQGHAVMPLYGGQSPEGARGGSRRLGMLTPEVKRLVAFSRDILPSRIISPELQAWLKEFKPDLVYSWLGSNKIIALVKEISEYCSIPVVPHFMDDWMSSNLPFPLFRNIQALAFRRSLQKLLPHCCEGVGISEAMAKEYAQRYSIPMDYAANGVGQDILQQLRSGAGAVSADNVLRVTVLGRLEYGRLKLLENFVKACQAMTLPDIQVILNICSTTPMPKGFPTAEYVKILWQKAPSNDHLIDIQKHTDVVLYIDSFDTFTRRYFRLSFSGKIPICLAIGRPIITIGPAALNSVRFLKSCALGPVITSPRIDHMRNAIEQIILWNQTKRKETGLRAWEIANSHHSSDQQSRRLQGVLLRCACREPID